MRLPAQELPRRAAPRGRGVTDGGYFRETLARVCPHSAPSGAGVVGVTLAVPLVTLCACLVGASASCNALERCAARDGSARRANCLVVRASWQPARWSSCSFLAAPLGLQVNPLKFAAVGAAPHEGASAQGAAHPELLNVLQADLEAAGARAVGLSAEAGAELLRLRDAVGGADAALPVELERVLATQGLRLTLQLEAGAGSPVSREGCLPGQRLYRDSEGPFCAPHQQRPHALNAEAMGDPAGVPSEQACGAWLREVPEVETGRPYAWWAAARVQRSLLDAALLRTTRGAHFAGAGGHSTLPLEGSALLVSRCLAHARANAATRAADARQAADALAAELHGTQWLAPDVRAAHALGLVASFGCPAGVELELQMPSPQAASLGLQFRDAELLDAQSLERALEFERFERATLSDPAGPAGAAEAAEAALEGARALHELASALASATTPAAAGALARLEPARACFRSGGLTQTHMETLVSSAYGHTVQLAHVQEEQLEVMRHARAFVCAAAQDWDPAAVGAALRLLSADCALEVAARLHPPQPEESGHDSTRRLRAAPALEDPLGRTQRRPRDLKEGMEPPQPEELARVRQRIARTSRTSRAGRALQDPDQVPAEPSDAQSEEAQEEARAQLASFASRLRIAVVDENADRCFGAARYFAAEALDEVLYELTISRTFERRLVDLVAEVREATAEVFELPSPLGLRDLVLHPELAAASIRGLKVRVPGAVGPELGRSRKRVAARHTSDEGAVATFMGARRAALRDAMQTVWEQDPAFACDMPPIYEATEANAYYLSQGNCVVLMLGVLHAPGADAAYDDESLYGRAGFILAHEFAHSSVSTPRFRTEYERLLGPYAPRTREEGLADVAAALALERLRGRRAGLGSCARGLQHVGQLFCARRDELRPDSDRSHPAGNDRSDLLGRVLQELVGLQCVA
jgi:hypothetical protein